MRIVQVITKADVGGAQTIATELTEGLVQRGHDVTLITGTPGRMSDHCASIGAHVRVQPLLKHAPDIASDGRAVLRIREQLQAIEPDILHLHSSKAGVVGRLAAVFARVPFVYTAHGWPFQQGAPTRQRILSFMGELAAGHLGGETICVNDAERTAALRLRVAPRRRLHTIQNGVGLPTAKPLSPPAAANNVLRVAMVARFAPPKRHDLVVDAVAILDGSVQVRFVGDGPGLQCTKERVARLGLQSLISFDGSRDDISTILASTDVLLLASDYEGMPVSILEGMRAGLPIIGTQSKGVASIVTHGTEGLICEPNAGALAKALQRLALHPSERRTMGANSFERWRSQHDADRMVESYIAVYDRVRLRRRSTFRINH